MFETIKGWFKDKAKQELNGRLDVDQNGRVSLDEALLVGAELGAVGLRLAANALADWAAAERGRLSGVAKWSAK